MDKGWKLILRFESSEKVAAVIQENAATQLRLSSILGISKTLSNTLVEIDENNKEVIKEPEQYNVEMPETNEGMRF